MTPDPGSLLPVAMQAVATATELMRTRRPASLTEKADRDLVSDVDLAIERAVRARLQAATPGIGFLGEEEGRSGDPGTGWLWTLDPIDGTSNFAHAIPLCACSLALLRDGRPVLAVIDAPFLGQRYHAIEGHGAYDGASPLAVSTTTRLRDAVVAIGDYATGHGADRKNETHLAATIQLAPRVHRIRMLGTAALDLAWVAAGHLDASITLSNKPWDTAAGVLLAREAGATVTDANGQPHTLHSAATIAAPAPLISQLVALIRAADLTADARDAPLRQPSPYAALDAILSRARHLIFDFDGPVCDLSAAMPPDTASQLRAILHTQAADLPPAVADTDDPLQILSCAAGISPAAAARIDAQLTAFEAAAAAEATSTAYLDEALAACRDSGRSTAVVSRHSAEAVSSYLNAHGLADQIRHIIAPASYPPGHLQTAAHLIEDTIHALGVKPAECALITASTIIIETGRNAGTDSIGYATTLAASEHLTAARAGSTHPKPR